MNLKSVKQIVDSKSLKQVAEAAISRLKGEFMGVAAETDNINDKDYIVVYGEPEMLSAILTRYPELNAQSKDGYLEIEAGEFGEPNEIVIDFAQITDAKDFGVYKTNGIEALLMWTGDGHVCIPGKNLFKTVSDDEWAKIEKKIHEATDNRKYGSSGNFGTYPVAVFVTDHPVDDREGEKFLKPLGNVSVVPGWAFEKLATVDLDDGKVATIGETFI